MEKTLVLIKPDAVVRELSEKLLLDLKKLA